MNKIKRDYASVHVHSEYSNVKVIDSINRYDRSINYAWDIGLSSVAMTEHDCLSGSIKYIKAFKAKIIKEWEKLNPEIAEKPSWKEMAEELDFKPILGNEIYLTPEGMVEDNMDRDQFYHLVLLAKDEEGFKQLKRLSSAAWKRSWFRTILRTPTYPSDLFEFVNGGHLVCSTACLGGYVAKTVAKILDYQTMIGSENDSDAALFGDEIKVYIDKLNNHLQMMEELFGKGNFYIELQPNELKGVGADQTRFNKYMIENYWGKYPFIFSTDAHYRDASEREIHKAFLNSKSSSDREVDSFYKYAYIMSQNEVKELMSSYLTDEQFNEMANNTKNILNMVSCYDLEQPKVIAEVEYEYYDDYEDDLEVFSDVTEKEYPNFYYFLTTENRADHYLAELIAHGYIEKLQDSWDINQYYSRIEEELGIIKEVGDKIGQSMSNYFITISKMVDLMWEAGSLVGPSRGSAGASLVLYLTGTTQMDPIKNDLPYMWRFMHPSRPDYPDVDVDSESDKRAQVFNKVRDYFRSIGGDVINVCTFGTEGTKSAIKTAGRGLNIDDDVISYLTSMIPNERGFDWSLSECYYGDEDKDRKPIKAFKQEMDKNPRLWELAQSIEGLVTRLGVHASGVICVNGDFIEHGSYMRTNKGQLVTAFDLHDQEECGVLKYDMLTVSALDRIHQTMNYMLEDGLMEWQGSLRATYNKYLDPNELKVDDLEMWDMAARGDIRSLFQFDTSIGSQSIKAIHPTNLAQLAISNSVMRLMAEGGEEQPLDKYVRFKNAPSLWYDDMRDCGLTSEEISIVEKYLKKKDGIADSQEVVMMLSMDPHISNFTMEEANKLRKTIA